MARLATLTRERILQAAYDRFYRQGFARVSVDDIAAAAGVTKKTLYYHFESKDALAGSVLDFQHEFALRQVQAWANADAKDAADFVGGIFASFARWASKRHWTGTGFTRIAMELADLPGHPARAAARRHKQHVEDWLATRLDALCVADARSAAQQVALLIEGCNALILIHGDTAYAAQAAAAARNLVNASPPPAQHRRRRRAR